MSRGLLNPKLFCTSPFQLAQLFNLLFKKAIGTRVEPASWISLLSGTIGSKTHLPLSEWPCVIELDVPTLCSSSTSHDRKSIRH